MKTVKKLIKTLICFLLIISLCGCWNNRELNQLSVVMGIGLDKPEKPYNVEVTAQIVKPSKIAAAGSKGGGGDGKAYWNIKDKGDCVFGTFRDMVNQSNHKLYFPHNQVIVMGKSLAEDGVSKYLDFFMRDPETRLNVLVFVAKGTAGEILDTQPELDKLPAVNMVNVMDAQSRAVSQTISVKLKDFKARLISKTTAPVAPYIELTGEDEPIVTITGTAVFKGDKMVGLLNKSEGRGLNWVLDEVKSTVIDVKSSQNSIVSMETIRAIGKFSPEIEGDKIKIEIDILEEGNIGEQTGPEDLSSLSEIEHLKNQKSEVIKSEVLAAIKKSKELKADIFGFGEAVGRKYPVEWRDMEDKWDEIYPKIEVEVNVKTQVRLMGRISKPAVPE